MLLAGTFHLILAVTNRADMKPGGAGRPSMGMAFRQACIDTSTRRHHWE